jgi:hypothetical protein
MIAYELVVEAGIGAAATVTAGAASALTAARLALIVNKLKKLGPIGDKVGDLLKPTGPLAQKLGELFSQLKKGGRIEDGVAPRGLAASGLRGNVSVADDMLDVMRQEGATILRGSDEIVFNGRTMIVDDYLSTYAKGDNAQFLHNMGDDGVILLRSDATRLEALEEFFHRDQLLQARTLGAKFPGDELHTLRYELDVQKRIKTYFEVTGEGSAIERSIVWDKIKELDEIIKNYSGGFRR